MEHGPFDDVFPIENGDIPGSYLSPVAVKHPFSSDRVPTISLAPVSQHEFLAQ